MQPLDLVKTRLQLQRSGGAATYNGVFDCFKKMYVQEGFASFYKGIVPPVVAETPKRAIKVSAKQDTFFVIFRIFIFFVIFQFLTFEQYKQLFKFGAPSPTPLV